MTARADMFDKYDAALRQLRLLTKNGNPEFTIKSFMREFKLAAQFSSALRQKGLLANMGTSKRYAIWKWNGGEITGPMVNELLTLMQKIKAEATIKAEAKPEPEQEIPTDVHDIGEARKLRAESKIIERLDRVELLLTELLKNSGVQKQAKMDL